MCNNSFCIKAKSFNYNNVSQLYILNFKIIKKIACVLNNSTQNKEKNSLFW